MADVQTVHTMNTPFTDADDKAAAYDKLVDILGGEAKEDVDKSVAYDQVVGTLSAGSSAQGDVQALNATANGANITPNDANADANRVNGLSPAASTPAQNGAAEFNVGAPSAADIIQQVAQVVLGQEKAAFATNLTTDAQDLLSQFRVAIFQNAAPLGGNAQADLAAPSKTQEESDENVSVNNAGTTSEKSDDEVSTSLPETASTNSPVADQGAKGGNSAL